MYSRTGALEFNSVTSRFYPGNHNEEVTDFDIGVYKPWCMVSQHLGVIRYNSGNPEFSWSVVLSAYSSDYALIPNLLHIVDPVSPVTISFTHTSSNCWQTYSFINVLLQPTAFPIPWFSSLSNQCAKCYYYFFIFILEWVHPCIIIISLPNCQRHITGFILLLRLGQGLNKFEVDWNVCIIHSVPDPSPVLCQLPSC